MSWHDRRLRHAHATVTALHEVDLPRPPGTSHSARRAQRRGRRSVEALRRRGQSHLIREFSQGDGRSEAGGPSPLHLDFEHFTFEHLNIRGFLGKRAELEGHLNLVENPPQLLALNETFLDKSIESVAISGYSLISRRDRRDGCGGGIALFALSEIAENITLLEHSERHERSWHILHADIGPVLFCIWYRPPCAGETASIASFISEWNRLVGDFVGTIVVGDLNVHHLHWLRFSTHTSVEGTMLFRFCGDNGFRQCVTEPTRGDNVLDLVLTDMAEVYGAEVGAQISDHRVVRSSVDLSVPRAETQLRTVYDYSFANWGRIRAELSCMDWSFIGTFDVDTSSVEFTRILLRLLDRFVPKRVVSTESSKHPWLNEQCLELIRKKRAAEGTPDFADAARACSEGILMEYHKYVDRTRAKFRRLRRGSKAWWRLASEIMSRKSGHSGVPALKRDDGTWERTAVGKAQLFVDTFEGRYFLPDAATNAYSWFVGENVRRGFLPIRSRLVLKVLVQLSADSATGPDGLAARVLKECALVLAFPLVRLARRIVATHRWPQIWTTHWVIPLFKRGSVFVPLNYRGIHLTAQVSKVMERILSTLFVPRLSRVAFGERQFAYRKGHGARDALALYVMRWVYAFNLQRKIAMYCSDVSGAFDRVSADLLLTKLRSFGLHEDILGVLRSWLRNRPAHVLVSGARSQAMNLSDMVFQGTVWGPSLWNAFFGDAAWAIRFADFELVVYADDLNAFREYPLGTCETVIVEDLQLCQVELHTWGVANQVTFDAAKEHMAILSHHEPFGENFVLLGVEFDARLCMNKAVHNCVVEVGWKTKTLVRTQRFHTDADLVNLWKSHILSYIEYRTAAWYHACETTLASLDRCLSSFLRSVGVDAVTALMRFNLAPLYARRDIAMLGIIHRAMLRQGPSAFFAFIRHCPPRALRHSSRQVRRTCRVAIEHRDRGSKLEMMRRSVLGLVSVYNLLPESVVLNDSVTDFQGALQRLLKECVSTRGESWFRMFSPRCDFAFHLLRSL